MNLVICTGIGLAGLLLCSAAFIGVLWVVIQISDRLQGKFSTPKWLEYLGGGLLIAISGTMLLFLSHDFGCRIIHLTMRH